MGPLDLVRLGPLMELTSGAPEIGIGLLDGPVALDHPDLRTESIREVAGIRNGGCWDTSSTACIHGTFVAGILAAQRGSSGLGICPECTLLVRPIFAETTSQEEQVPSATPKELAQAITDVIDAGARIINLSVALIQSAGGEAGLVQALNHAARIGVIVVAAAGNQGALCSSVITRHPWVIPVVAYELQGRVLSLSNLGSSIGMRGVGAPGEGVRSLRAAGGSLMLGGTSVAAPFITGAIALLWSYFPGASAAELKLAVSATSLQRRSIAPPLLNVDSAFAALASGKQRISL